MSRPLNRGYGAKINTASYKADMKIHRPDLVVLGEYTGAGAYIEVRSKVCGHTFKGKASVLRHGVVGKGGCSNCSRKVMHLKRKGLSPETFAEKLDKLKPNLKITGDFVNLTTPLAVSCTQCGHEFSTAPHRLLTLKYACIECSRLNTGYARKIIKLKGRSFNVQGYEGIFLENLAEHYPQQFREVKGGASVPKFTYTGTSPNTGNKIKRTYRPDFFIESRALIVEIKSTYTAAGSKELFNNLKKKRNAVIKAGYKFSLVMFSPKGKHLRLPSDWYKLPYSKGMFNSLSLP